MIFLFMLKDENKEERIKTSNAIVVLKINNGKLDLERFEGMRQRNRVNFSLKHIKIKVILNVLLLFLMFMSIMELQKDEKMSQFLSLQSIRLKSKAKAASAGAGGVEIEVATATATAAKENIA